VISMPISIPIPAPIDLFEFPHMPGRPSRQRQAASENQPCSRHSHCQVASQNLFSILIPSPTVTISPSFLLWKLIEKLNLTAGGYRQPARRHFIQPQTPR
jgi:hypothetical protein